MSHVKRTILLSIFISLSFATVLAQQPAPPAVVHTESGTWITVAPANAGFTVTMPAKPAENVQAVDGHPGLENLILSLETKLAGYVVSSVQFPDEITDPGAIKLMLDRGREGGLESSKGRLRSEKEIKLGPYFGREWVVDLPGNLETTARAYWVKRRLYQTIFVVAVNASELAGDTKLRRDAEAKFLDSFTLSDASK